MRKQYTNIYNIIIGIFFNKFAKIWLWTKLG
jgi:hypothetical protein